MPPLAVLERRSGAVKRNAGQLKDIGGWSGSKELLSEHGDSC